MTVQLARRLMTVADYEQLIETGVLGEDDRVELLNGEIVPMSSIGGRHAACVKRINQLLVQQLGGRAIVGVQDPIRLNDLSEPEPDLSVMAFRVDYYADQHPEPSDVLLLIEVADTSAQHDRTVKVPLYAQAGIPEVWLVDLAAGHVDAFRHPAPAGYLLRRRHLPGQTISLAEGLDLSVAVDGIVGPGSERSVAYGI